MSRLRRALAALGGLAAVVALGSGCQAELLQEVVLDERGTGRLTLTLRLDRDAQAQINLDRQLAQGTFLEFLRPDLPGWEAPDGSAGVISDRTEGDGVRVLETRRAILSTPDDLRRVLDVRRRIEQIVSATGVYQVAPPEPDEEDATTTAGTTVAGPPRPARSDSTLTDLPAAAPLQNVLVMRFDPAGPEPGQPATYRLAVRGGVGEIADATCSPTANPSPTTADEALAAGLELRYRYGFPVDVESASEGAETAGRTAAWRMPYGQCDLIEASSAGADSSAAVNGLILGAALAFIILVLGLRILSRRRGRRLRRTI